MTEQNIQVGDFVQGRLYNEDRTNVAVQNFIVSSINDTLYLGGILDCDTNLGWSVELIRKLPENLNLPQVLSEITAYDKNNKKHYLTGKSDTWRNENGNLIDVGTLVSWENGHI